MNNLSRIILVSALLCGPSSTSFARTIPLEVGRAPTSSQSSCFNFWNGAVFNSNCSGYPIWEVGLVTEGGSSIQASETGVTSTIIRPSEITYVWASVVASEPISGYWSISSASATSLYGWQSFVFGGLANIPSTANVYAKFQMPQGTGVLNVRY